MKHIIVSSAELATPRDLAAFIGNTVPGLQTEAAMDLAAALIADGWVSIIRIDPAPAP